jgi:hypothetical protein
VIKTKKQKRSFINRNCSIVSRAKKKAGKLIAINVSKDEGGQAT